MVKLRLQLSGEMLKCGKGCDFVLEVEEVVVVVVVLEVVSPPAAVEAAGEGDPPACTEPSLVTNSILFC